MFLNFVIPFIFVYLYISIIRTFCLVFSYTVYNLYRKSKNKCLSFPLITSF